MPLREYVCKECGDSVEILEPREKKPECKCKGEDAPIPMESKIGKTSFVLKGRGWFKSGYQPKR